MKSLLILLLSTRLLYAGPPGIPTGFVSTWQSKSSSSYSCPLPTSSGVLAWYPLDDTSGSDFSGNGYNLTLYSFPPSVAGQITNALSFNGSSQNCAYLDSGNHFAFSSGSSAFMVCCWIYPTTLSSGNYSRCISRNYDNNGWYLGYQGGGVIALRGGSFIQTGGIPENAWTHIAVLYDGTNTMSVITNGILANSTSASGSISSTSSAYLTIAVENSEGSDYDYFTGYIDDPQIYGSYESISFIYNIWECGYFNHQP